MNIESIKSFPATLDEALDDLIMFFSREIDLIKKVEEEYFTGTSHFGLGTFIRNTWFLWWYEDSGYAEWPDEKPELNKWFESIGIVHPDDMSGIILTSFYRKIKGIPIDLNCQIKRYQEHWKNNGFPDGIPKKP